MWVERNMTGVYDLDGFLQIRGTNLYLTWPGLSVDQRRKVGLAVADVWAQLMRLRFGVIGSINASGDDEKSDSVYVGPMTFIDP
jgi:hypothetical protein